MPKTERPYSIMTKAEREDFTKALVEEVRGHPAIWQMESGVYRDNAKKARAWAEISAGLSQTETTCQTTWKNARAYYSKIKRDKVKRTEEGEEADECFWVHFKAMDFLAPYVDDRAGKRRRENPSEDGDFLSSYSFNPGGIEVVTVDGEAKSEGEELLTIPASSIFRSATSTPSSACPNDQHKRRREDPNELLDLHKFDAYIEAIVAKKLFTTLPAKNVTAGAAFGQFLGVVLDQMPEQQRNDKILALLNTLHAKPDPTP